MHHVALLIGGNQGDRQALIAQATERIRQRIGSVVAFSRIVETEPWGTFEVENGEEKVANFLNQALLVDTPLSAHECLREALDIEKHLGRQRPSQPSCSPGKSNAPSSCSLSESNALSNCSPGESEVLSNCSPCQGELSAGLRGRYDARRNLKENKLSRRLLRTNGTSAEAFLWTFLKNRQLSGYKFRRQYGIEKYILDFYCPELHLAVELDGNVYYDTFKRQREYDLGRDEYLLREYGIRVLRFENRMVFEHLKSVIGWIEEAVGQCGGKVSPYDWGKHAALGCSPCQGELPAGVRGEGDADVGPLRPSATSPCQGEERGMNVSCQGEERGMNGSRTYHSRPIDIDLIFFDHEVIDTPDLVIPHPRMHLRRFVLEPLAEIIPDYVHPVLNKTVTQLLHEI